MVRVVLVRGVWEVILHCHIHERVLADCVSMVWKEREREKGGVGAGE